MITDNSKGVMQVELTVTMRVSMCIIMRAMPIDHGNGAVAQGESTGSSTHDKGGYTDVTFYN